LTSSWDHIVIGEHQRLVAARRLSYKTVPAIFVDLSPEQSHLLNLALNRISGDWDEQLLARMLADLQANAVDLEVSGFDADEINRLLKELEASDKRERLETFDLDAALAEAEAKPVTQPGDLWLLGEHRLLCGDSTSETDVALLLNGTKAAVAFTDPPYNVSYGDHGGQQRGTRRRRIQNDSLPPAEWESFCRGWGRNLLGSVDGAVYICMSSREWPTVSRILEEAGAHWSDTIIWAKDRFTLGRADYQRQYEPLWYGWLEGAKHHWRGDRDQGDVWTIRRPDESPLHPTMKPVELIERAIANSSRTGEIVLDLFLGSGSTVIAAERTARVCYAMERDPQYVQVAVARWEAFSGQKAGREHLA
jgi:DNA modification methylase